MSSRTLKRAPVSSAPTRIIQSRINTVTRAQAGNKEEIRNIMQTGRMATFGMTTLLTPVDIDSFNTDQLYELAYGGTTDYFRNPIFTKQRQEEIKYISDLTKEDNVTESIYKCPNCGYNRIRVKQVQVGGGDESMTSIYRCTRCSNKWSNNGRG